MRAKAKYAVIYRYKEKYPVLVMCRFFAVSRSGYYNFVKRMDRAEKDAALAETIRQQQTKCFHSESCHGNEDWHYCWADGMLNFFDYAFCPHYNEDGRKSFDSKLKEKDLTGLPMENDTAFVEDNGNQYFIKSNSSAKAFEIRYRNGLMEKRPIEFLL